MSRYDRGRWMKSARESGRCSTRATALLTPRRTHRDNALDALLTKASARLDVIGAEGRGEVIDLIEAIRDARAGDCEALDTSRKQLEDLLFYLET